MPLVLRLAFKDGTTGHIPFSEYALGAATARRWQLRTLSAPRRRCGHARRCRDGGADKSQESGIFTLCQVPEISGALVAMDPHSGRVLAISGGFSFETSQFDRATQAKRQPGSSIKPFVYLTALDHGFTPSTLVVDGPISLPQGPGLPMWSPTNYADQYHAPTYRGPTPLRVGLEESLNAMTARVASIVGMEPIAQTIERFGIMEHTPREYSMALGTGETTLLRMTTAYSMLANGGQARYPEPDRSRPGPRWQDDPPGRPAALR